MSNTKTYVNIINYLDEKDIDFETLKIIVENYLKEDDYDDSCELSKVK